ncbi:uncharacterized protein LOC117899391 [Drosophila subobscura]|uniref:uncharacterized protein LOC117899391 n=1 Tax=Drosophila subobscura TaxID=7241 RepID=UPI00155B0BD3|nr:uncharacterized protein LOC117899391 [Drosophila subobscura]
MAFLIMSMLSILVVLAQGSQLPTVGQVSTVGSPHTSGFVSSGSGGIHAASQGHYRPVIGSAVPQPHRPVIGHGSVVSVPAGATRRVSGSRHQSALPVAATYPQASGTYQRLAAAPVIGSRPRQIVGSVLPVHQPQGAYGNAHQNRNHQQKPY